MAATPSVPGDPGTRDRAGHLARLVPALGPQRVLAWAYLVNTIGSGLYAASSAIFFTRSMGLSALQVGVGLTIGSFLGLLAGAPVGHLADRYGARETFIVSMVVGGCAMASFCLVHTFAAFVLVACVMSAVGAAGQAARGPLVRGFGGDDPVRFRAYLRSVTNLGMALGALAAGICLHFDSRPVYLALILGNAVSFLGCAALVCRLPRLPVVSAPPTTRSWIALRDRGYAAATALNGVMSVHYAILTYALPLWIVQRTSLPHWLVPATMLLNTVLVTAFQVRASAGVRTPVEAGRAMLRTGVAVLAGATLMAASADAPMLLALAFVILGTAVYTLGELWQSAASFELCFGLAPAYAQGQYSGLFNLGQGTGVAAAPTILGLLCLDWGVPGWLLLGALIAAMGAVAPFVTRWAVERSPADG